MMTVPKSRVRGGVQREPSREPRSCQCPTGGCGAAQPVGFQSADLESSRRAGSWCRCASLVLLLCFQHTVAIVRRRWSDNQEER